ncbi:MAG: hypothetical protein QME21_14255 [Anaerolineales bacterium]|nr:hypothetical protein [Anaerolineales bacterium]
MKLNEALPVVISVFVIILVAILEKQSKLIAAITATMPLTIPLALWIVYSSSHGDRQLVENFTRSMVTGIIPTVAFAVTLWFGARAGLKLVSMIALGYTVWAAVLLFMLGVRHWIG